MNIFDELPRPFFVLAPMDDVTDTVFRQVIADTAKPDLFFTEFVNVDGLQSPGRERLLKKIKLAQTDRPCIVQIWGKTPENYYKTAQELAEMGFAGIDINMGCPDKTIVKNGCCSALIENRPLALEIIQATREGAAGKLPVSVKTRLGFKQVDLTWHELLLKQELPMLTLHGRTQREMSAVPAHWDLIGEVRKMRDQLAPQTIFVGNGDVANRAQGMELAEKYQLDGIMIGRGIFQDPYAFASESPWLTFDKNARMELFEKHIRLFQATWPNGERKIAPLNKFCKIYINHFDGAKELREHLMNATSTEELLNILSEARQS
jgi:tRNA-dihydrouridine synthase